MSLVLVIRTDKPEAEIGLFSVDGKKLAYKSWQAHRELGQTIHLVIRELLSQRGAELSNLSGIIFYEGPGSFTGLRIGASVANALSAACSIPLAQAASESWIQAGLALIADGETVQARPLYGSEARTTLPKK